MLLDNVSHSTTLSHFLIENTTETGGLDLVSGYFSISGINMLNDNLNAYISVYRLIVSELIEKQAKGEKTIDLLADNPSILDSFYICSNAIKAINFLKQEKVKVKTLKPKFCHAKTYIYLSELDARHHYFVIGSSNLTHNGLGITIPISNIELNYASTGNSNDFHETKQWFNNIWNSDESKSTLNIDENHTVDFKEYLIDQLSNFIKEYQPEEVYYKILYEFFYDSLAEGDLTFQAQLSELHDTVIWSKLYNFQKKGVLSLIRRLQRWNGAILADAVGLGKTWQALAVMRFFQSQGYKILLLCPKRLGENWKQYMGEHHLFSNDDIEFVMGHHTDLSIQRIGNDPNMTGLFKKKTKLLIIIDESHNLRNEKSSRYEYLVNHLLQKNEVVKVLLLSATPINTKIKDVRAQFKLMCKGKDDGYLDLTQGKTLTQVFSQAQKTFTEWENDKEKPSLQDFINRLPDEFFSLCDNLLVARTRDFIKQFAGEYQFDFPEKKGINLYIGIPNIGSLSIDELFEKTKPLRLTGYRPNHYIEKPKIDNQKKKHWDDETFRQKYLVQMMYILMVKRLESCWYSFQITIGNILNHHKKTLTKVDHFLNHSFAEAIYADWDFDNNDQSEEFIESVIDNLDLPSDEQKNQIDYFTVGKANPIPLKDLKNIDGFRADLVKDIELLQFIFDELANTSSENDEKLNELHRILKEKQSKSNPKVVVFTTYTSTAEYLYNNLVERGITNIALITGKESVFEEKKYKRFNGLLKQFAPYTKLYKEGNWDELYQRHQLEDPSFEEWKNALTNDISDEAKNTLAILNNPINILIATDCLSEGQNLQDADTIINYDIHWNPVRLVQRMGRIDRIGSPNKEIFGYNFWPGKDFEDVLNLKHRVEKRMKLLSLIGVEIEQTDENDLKPDNPLIDEQTEKMLKIMSESWEGIETGDQTIGFDDLTFEHLRQQLWGYFQQFKEKFEAMPNGVFTGCRKNNAPVKSGIVALLHRKRENAKRPYPHSDLELAYCTPSGDWYNINFREVLIHLQKIYQNERFISDGLNQTSQETVLKYRLLIKSWFEKKRNRMVNTLFGFGLFDSGATKDEGEMIEEKYVLDNYELITWWEIND